ncbi:unnamed protein product [Dicrocoelium dendriticum]|nr:unnamed protein product [Dicrocoelium dendriticum]
MKSPCWSKKRFPCMNYLGEPPMQTNEAPKAKQAGIKDSVASATPEKTDEDGSKAPGVDFYLDQIRQLERRADILRTHAGELKAEVDVLLTELTQSDDEKRVTLRLLKAEFEQKINENANLRERIYGTYAMHRLQATKWEARQQELELQKELTVKRITEEIHSLTEQLNALEDFREKREILLLQYGELESTLQKLISDHALALETLAQKDGAYRRRLKKNAALEVNKAASVSRELSFRRTQPTYKRILADNVSTESCLTKFVNEVDAMTKENKALHENIETLKIQRCTLLREQESLASKSSAVAKKRQPS